MAVRVLDGAPVHECGLCGARFGDRAAVASLQDADEARTRGIAASIWPLVRVLERLPGLSVRAAQAADADAATLPFVELRATSADCLGQLENVCKSLRLAAGALRRRWLLEVGYVHTLVFVLKPARDGGPVTRAEVRDAGLDVDVLWRQLERDMSLPFWRHATAPPPG
jgi:hypothetical protein